VARRSKRRTRFATELEVSRRLLDFGDTDAMYLRWTEDLFDPHIDDILAGVGGKLDGPSSDMGEDQSAAPRPAWKRWLQTLVHAPLNAKTAEQTAAFAHELVRPRDGQRKAINARYIVLAMSVIQSRFVALLGESVHDPRELVGCTIAWSKCFMIHANIVLSVYSSTEASRDWY
jgi:Protoglobin